MAEFSPKSFYTQNSEDNFSAIIYRTASWKFISSRPEQIYMECSTINMPLYI